ncbi:amino acid adenylation domain-containing protein [Actinoplanes sp. NPDC048988]|uniref:amino acid adenylation domain-containing protein n=1 Tax=Actinoplanes sp. NPDC048988 TaxID=3363901 RepID=UPI00371A0969
MTVQTRPDVTMLPELIHARVDTTPQATAVVCGDRRLSYAELWHRAGITATRLRRAGARPGQRVAVCLDRDIELLVTLLGILRAGAAYLPLDPEHPAERLAGTVEDSGASLIVARGVPSWLPDGVRTLSPDATAEPAADGPVTGAHPAYTIYTSGSTGRPKGVVISHRALANFMRSMQESLPLGEGSTMAAVTTVSFDIAALELFLPLLCGARVVIARAAEATDPVALAALMERHGATAMQATPATWQMLRSIGWRAPEGFLLLCGGERLPADLGAWLTSFPGGQAWDLYGPTETTIWSTAARLGPGGRVAHWAPLLNTDIRILDEKLAPVAGGEAGELCIGGDGLADGYVDRPDLTADKFRPDPYADRPGGRLYRTGDLARRRRDGSVEIIDRIDNQVKIRGYRVELGEIETALAAHAGVGQAVVHPVTGAAGGKLLAAYVIPTGTPPDPAELTAWLAAKLPAYMLPARYTTVAAFPLTGNGKIDRKALADLPAAPAGRPYAPPRSPVERAVAAVWSEVLGHAGAGLDDDFLELGGTSLAAARMLGALRERLDAEVPMALLLEHVTLREQAAAITRILAEPGHAPAGGAAIPRADRSRPIPLSPAQQRLWFAAQLRDTQATDHTEIRWRVRGTLDLPALRQALERVADRHEILRTAFPAGPDGRPHQRILDDPAAGFTFRVSRDEHSADPLDAALRAPFDPAHGPLMRVDVAVCGPDEHLLQIQWHHLVFDGVSTELFRAELAAAYTAVTAGNPERRAPLPLQHADASAWLCAAEPADAGVEEYWRGRLSGLPALTTLPPDRPRPATPTGAGARLWRELPAELVTGLTATAARHRLTPYMALLAGFGVTLSRYCGSHDVVVGSPVTDRDHADLQPLIGFFLNTLVLRLEADGAASVRDYLAGVRRTAIGAFGHASMPFDRLVETVRPERSGAYHPLFQVLFNHDAADLDGPGLPGLRLTEEPVDPGAARFDLAVTVRTAGGVPARVEFEYATDLFDRATVDRFADHYLRLLTALAAAAPEDPLDALPMLTAEDEAGLRPHHAPPPRRSAGRRVHDLVRAWVSRTPDAVAVSADGADVTYAELDRRANRLAHRLRGHGMPAGAVVGTHLTPGADLVVAMLAVLKAGGAYLPLDPAQPAERRRTMIEDAGCRFLVGAPPPAGAGPDLVVLPAAEPGPGDEPDTEPATDCRPDDLAYVLYTSGSTGAPKGVAMPHLALVDLIDWHIRQQLAGVRTAQLAAISFDVSFQEIFIPLASGGTVVMAPAAIRGEPDRIAAWLAAAGVAQLITTPTMLEQLCRSWREQPAGTPPRLAEVTVAGEQFAPTATVIGVLGTADVTVHNQYGPAETHCVTAHRCSSLREAMSPPIGRAVPGKRIYLLDRLLRPVPPGLPGEIFIGGEGIARGYFARPGLTAERFLPDPFTDRPGGRMYRTGDVARRDRDGLLHFLGRADRQIKIRGVRVEPAEVEAALVTHPRVRAAAVVASEAGPGDRRLAAYVVPAGDDSVDPAGLDGWLARTLPRYMIPSGYLAVTALPTTVSGKLDRAALPPFPWHTRAAEPVAPRTDAERRVAEIWADALQVPTVGVHDNFFAIGGHSLLAARLAARLRERIGAVSIRDIFEAPTVAELARRATAGPAVGQAVEDAPRPVPRDTALPLSYAQQRLWFLDQLHPGATDYHLGWALRLRGPLDVTALRRALGRIVERHEILRTGYPAAGGLPAQEVLPPAPVELPTYPVTGAAGLDEAIRRECARPFDLAAGRVFRAALLRTGPAEHVLVGVAHHIAADGWSLAVVDRELAAGYEEAVTGRPAAETPLPVQYGDYAAWEQQRRTPRSLAPDLDYWRTALAGVRPLSLGDRRSAGPPGAAGVETFRLDPADTTALDELAADRQATLFMVLASAFALVLGKRAGTDDVTVGVPVAGRDVPGVADLVGCFVNTVVLRTRLRPAEPYADLLDRTRRAATEMYQRQHVPFDLVVRHVAPRREAAHNPLFDAMISMTEESRLSLPGLAVTPVPVPGTDASFALDLRAERRSDGSLHGELEYDTARFSAAAAARIAAQYQRILRTIGRDPRLAAGRL